MELQTDLLKHETGAIAITCRVLHHDRNARNRLVILSSALAHEQTPQAVAYTLLTPHMWAPNTEKIDTELAHGGLMGETFRAHGMTVRQNRLLRIRVPLVSRSLARLYQAKIWHLAEVECYEFWAGATLYGVVLEIKNPRRSQTPMRPKLGAFSYWQKRQVTPHDFIPYLDRTAQPKNSLWRARLRGFCIAIQLFSKARTHTRRHNHALRLDPTQPPKSTL